MVRKDDQKILADNKPSIREIEIVRLSSEGAGVGFLDGKTVFVPGMLPGEIGKVGIGETKKNYLRAEVVDLFTICLKGRFRIVRFITTVGGCELQHLNYAYTLEWKRQWVEDALSRIGGLRDVQVEPVIGMEEPWRYRNKGVLHRDREGRLGYYKEKTKEIVPL